MPELTLEYIELVQSDEAQCLQDGHEIELGEWRVLAEGYGDDRPWFVAEHRGDCNVWGRHAEGSPAGCFYTKERSRWLPGLHQLLQIIEGAGYRVGFSTMYEGARRVYWLSAKCAESYIDEIESDLMLAAAKLAVAALEGKE